MSWPRVGDADLRSSEHGTVIVLMVLSFSLGFVTIIGHAQRWVAPAYEVALQVPGAPESWGWALIILSWIASLGYWHSEFTFDVGKHCVALGKLALIVGMFLVGMWFLFFGLSFLLQFIQNSTVSANGALINFIISILYIQRSVMYWRGEDDLRGAR